MIHEGALRFNGVYAAYVRAFGPAFARGTCETPELSQLQVRMMEMASTRCEGPPSRLAGSGSDGTLRCEREEKTLSMPVVS